VSEIDKIIEAARTIPSFECSTAATKKIIGIFEKLGHELGYEDSRS
jgi:hypothetical protein